MAKASIALPSGDHQHQIVYMATILINWIPVHASIFVSAILWALLIDVKSRYCDSGSRSTKHQIVNAAIIF
jgi:hypothetical protein